MSKATARNFVAECGNIIVVVDLDIILQKAFQVCLIYFFNVSKFTFFSLEEEWKFQIGFFSMFYPLHLGLD